MSISESDCADCANVVMTLELYPCQADDRFFWNKTMLADLLGENYKVSLYVGVHVCLLYVATACELPQCIYVVLLNDAASCV